MRKKLLALALAATVVLTFAACGSNGNDSKTNSNTNASTPTSSAQASTPESSAEASSASLADWVKSDECKQLENMTNSAISGQGMSVKFSADGNILVTEYILDEYLDVSGISEDEINAAFAGLADEMSGVFSGFESDYGVKLDGLRAVVTNSDGSEIYSEELANK